LRSAQFGSDTRSERDDNDVALISCTGWPGQVCDLIPASNNPFGKKKSGSQFIIVSWCPHRRRDRLAANLNFERFLNREIVSLIFQRPVRLSPNNLAYLNPVFFHWFADNVIMALVEICHIYISRGHNFVGHYGREPDSFSMIEVPAIKCVMGRGLMGDRYFDFKENYKGQITFFSLEVFDELCGALRVKGVVPSAVRRNVFTRNVDLNKLIGHDFEVQGVHFHGTEESRPCDWMNRAIAPGAKEFLKGRGGLRARILNDGTLRSSPRFLDIVE
jgi:hypothetical protein